MGRKTVANRISMLALVVGVLWSGLVASRLHAGPAEELAALADGKADASAVLQKWIDAAGGRVELPAGTLRLTTTVEIDLPQVGFVSIEGSAATRIVMEGPGPAFRIRGSHFKSADPSGFRDEVWQHERMPTLVGFGIEGAHPDADGVEAIGTMQLTCSRLHLRQLRHGIRLLENNRNVLVDACHIYENRGVGIYYDDVNLHQSNIVGCHISYCHGGGIVSRGGNVRNIHISGCDLESNMSADTPPTANIFIDCRGSSYGTAEVAISGCTIQHNDQGPESANIRIIGRTQEASDSGPQAEGHVTITGNVLSDVQTNVWLEACRGVTLTGNTFWMGFEYNLRLDECSHVVMAANNFDRNPRYDYGHSTTSQNRLSVRNSRDCTLMGIHIAHVTGGAALRLENCQRMNVSGLTILDCDIGLELVEVRDSLFTGCLIDDQRSERESRQLVISGGGGNRFDDSLSPPAAR